MHYLAYDLKNTDFSTFSNCDFFKNALSFDTFYEIVFLVYEIPY